MACLLNVASQPSGSQGSSGFEALSLIAQYSPQPPSRYEARRTSRNAHSWPAVARPRQSTDAPSGRSHGRRTDGGNVLTLLLAPSGCRHPPGQVSRPLEADCVQFRPDGVQSVRSGAGIDFSCFGQLSACIPLRGVNSPRRLHSPSGRQLRWMPYGIPWGIPQGIRQGVLSEIPLEDPPGIPWGIPPGIP